MKNSCRAFRVGTRSSPLALCQTRQALDGFHARLPATVFDVVEVATPGDHDHKTDLRESPPDFFTRTLDKALLEKRIDLAVHSAKDLPEPVPSGIDWFWLPQTGDRRDVLVGSSRPRVIGVSSERRAAYARRRFPDAVLKPVRGNIQQRLQQLDQGRFDLLVMAGVALQRLAFDTRIAEWIPLSELETPEGQGTLAVTFRQGDKRMNAIRSLFVKAATFAGAGVCEAHLTLDARRALSTAEVCLYDALMDDTVLNYLPAGTRKVYVGKRQGDHSRSQPQINQRLCDEVRKGRRTVRLKGGDPGIFGRLAEEVEALESLALPYRVIPGISSMQTAAANTGIQLTRRGCTRGFTVMTPRMQAGATGPVNAAARADLPSIFFMAISKAEQIADELIDDGMSGDTPCALVFAAGSDRETVYQTRRTELKSTIAQRLEPQGRQPGLLFVGEIARCGGKYPSGALGGRRILLTCSDALMDRAVQAVYDMGGRPLRRPLIRLQTLPCAAAQVRRFAEYDWIALTSPAAVRCWHELLLEGAHDLRRLPAIMATGPGTVHALQQAGLGCDLVPETNFSTDGLLNAAASRVKSKRVLRLRSRKAGSALTDGLRRCGADVVDCVLYENLPVCYQEVPVFDAVFFASSSAVESFVNQWGADILHQKIVLTMGKPTAAALRARGVQPAVTGSLSTVGDNLRLLGAYYVHKVVFPQE